MEDSVQTQRAVIHDKIETVLPLPAKTYPLLRHRYGQRLMEMLLQNLRSEGVF